MIAKNASGSAPAARSRGLGARRAAASLLSTEHRARRARAWSARGSRDATAAAGTARGSSRRRRIWASTIAPRTPGTGAGPLRVEPMYADGGHLYVFLVYGMHCCANVVTRREGVPRGRAPARGAGPGLPAPARLLSGPGKLCAALGITTADSGADLLGGTIRIFRRGGSAPATRRLAANRRGLCGRGGGVAAEVLRSRLARRVEESVIPRSVSDEGSRARRVRDPSLRSG